MLCQRQHGTQSPPVGLRGSTGLTYKCGRRSSHCVAAWLPEFNPVTTSVPLRLNGQDKLDALRKLDPNAGWISLDDQRYCTRCNHLISGRQIEVAGGTRAHGPLRLQCPTAACEATPEDWTTPARRNQRGAGDGEQ